MFGKVLVIKVFGLSLFIYVMKSIGLPLTILQRINKMFFSFIWKRNFKEGRTFERIKRKVLCTEVEEDGLNMIDIHAMQECFMIKWCLKMIVDQNEKWTALPKKYLESVGEVNAFLCDTLKEDFKGLNTISSDFWKKHLFSLINQFPLIAPDCARNRNCFPSLQRPNAPASNGCHGNFGNFL